jgi:hypothetical protein
MATVNLNSEGIKLIKIIQSRWLSSRVDASSQTPQEAANRTTRAMQEALDLKTRLHEELERENQRLVEEREYDIAKITELKEDELERLQRAIKTQYAQPKQVLRNL